MLEIYNKGNARFFLLQNIETLMFANFQNLSTQNIEILISDFYNKEKNPYFTQYRNFDICQFPDFAKHKMKKFYQKQNPFYQMH